MLFDDTYRTITKRSEGIYREKGSKFIAIAFPVATEEEVKECLLGLRKEYYDARHHCYAWQLGFDKSAHRINDDGEPSGTAGRPIFGQIQSFDLTNILIVVVRYFGGIKLGVSGLINAYKVTAKEAIEQANIEERYVKELFNVIFPYEQLSPVMKILKEEGAEIKNTIFEMESKLDFSIRKQKSDQVIFKLKKVPGLKSQFISFY